MWTTLESVVRFHCYRSLPLLFPGDQCTVEFAKSNPISTNPRAKCQVVTGDVVISGSGVTLASLADWDRVEELHGTIEVDGTDLDNITIFNNLKNISNPSPGQFFRGREAAQDIYGHGSVEGRSC